MFKNKLFQNRKILLIFLFALLIRIIFIFDTPLRIWDETIYANLGHDLSTNPLSYTFKNKFYSDYAPDGSWPKAGFRPPLLPYLLSLFYLLKIDFLIMLLMP